MSSTSVSIDFFKLGSPQINVLELFLYNKETIKLIGREFRKSFFFRVSGYDTLYLLKFGHCPVERDLVLNLRYSRR